MEEIIDLREKNKDEVFRKYKEIAIRSKILREIWNKAKDYDKAMQVYNSIKDKVNNVKVSE